MKILPTINPEDDDLPPDRAEAVLSEIEKQILSHFLELDSKGRFPNSPKTPDELHIFVRLAYNINIPKTVVIEGHRAPFEFLCDLFFEYGIVDKNGNKLNPEDRGVKNALAFGSRGSGKTHTVAVLNHLECIFKPECEIAHAGAVRAQAKQAFKNFAAFCQLDWFKDMCQRYEALTGKPFVVKETQEEYAFANGASQSIIVASEKGLRSPHPQKARLDEIDLMEWGLIQTGLSMVRNKKVPKLWNGKTDIRGQNVFTSTRQLEHGTMQTLIDRATEMGFKVYEWNIWDVLEKCTRQCENDPVYGTCPILTFCGGRAHNSDGFYPIDDFCAKVQGLDRDTFEVEWENKRPSRARLVYPMLDTKHHMTSEMLYKMTGERKPHPYWQVVSGLDFGFSPGHPTVYTKFCQLPTGPWLMFYCYSAEQRLLRDHAQAIKNSPFWKYSEAIYADWDAQDRTELKELGIRLQLANKDVEMGIDHIRHLLRGTPPLETPNLYFWVSDVDDFKPVTGALEELGKYAYPVGVDGRPVSTKPIKMYDNAADSTRYALYTWKQRSQGPTYRSYSIPGL